MWASLIVIQSEGASNAVTAVISTCRNDTLTRVPPTLGFRFHKASRQAWNRLIALCCAGNKKLYKSEAGIHSIYKFTYALDRTYFSNGLVSLNNTPHSYYLLTSVLCLPIYSHLGPLCTLLELGSFLNKPVHLKEFRFPVFVPFPPCLLYLPDNSSRCRLACLTSHSLPKQIFFRTRVRQDSSSQVHKQTPGNSSHFINAQSRYSLELVGLVISS